MTSLWTDSAKEKVAILQNGMFETLRFAQEAGLSAEEQKDLLAPYVSAIEELYTDEYPLAKALDCSDIVIHIEGPAVDTHTPRVSLLASVFSSVNEEIRNIASAILGLTKGDKLPKDLDLSLTALAPGSLYVGLKLSAPRSEPGQVMAENAEPYYAATKQAVQALGVVSRNLNADGPTEGLAKDIPNPRVRDVALAAVQRLSPSEKRRKDITSVEIGISEDGNESRRAIKLTSETRKTLKTALHRKIDAPSAGTFEGWIREIDLDLRRFELRRLEVLESFELRCKYPIEFEKNVKALLDKRAVVTGLVQTDETGAPSLLEVEKIEPFVPPLS